jgi:subtilase family serine protease
VGTTPINTLSGNFQYTVYADGAQAAQGSCAVPADEGACYSGHHVTGVQAIEVRIDSNNAIAETDETNNSLTATCDKYDLTCE